MTNRFKAAMQAIKDFYGDTKVSKEETMRGLLTLRDEIDLLIDALSHK